MLGHEEKGLICFFFPSSAKYGNIVRAFFQRPIFQNFGTGRQGHQRCPRWGRMTSITIIYMLLLGMYRNFMIFHLQRVILEGGFLTTSSTVWSSDWRYFKMPFHFSFITNACQMIFLEGSFLKTQIDRLFTFTFWNFLFYFPFQTQYGIEITK